jgi:hypothetical protein
VAVVSKVTRQDPWRPVCPWMPARYVGGRLDNPRPGYCAGPDCALWKIVQRPSYFQEEDGSWYWTSGIRGQCSQNTWSDTTAWFLVPWGMLIYEALDPEKQIAQYAHGQGPPAAEEE